MTKETEENFIVLPRGGYLVPTSAGSFQVGIPPETIKDTMLLPAGVPQFFIIADEMFDWGKGINIAEVEFPLFYNFFIKKQKTYIICREDQYRALRAVLQESVFGPKEMDISSDFASEYPHIPDIASEMTFFRNNLKLSDLVSFGIFSDDRFRFKGVSIRREKGFFNISDNGKNPVRVPSRIEYTIYYQSGERLPEPYMPPLFGITCLGPSHGFDPTENTSGFIIWLNHMGIMIDPPVNSTEWLEDSNVNPKLIDSIILTHCHSDHDAGTFQKILEESKVTVYATETVMMSFLRKYSAVTGVPVSHLMGLFTFHPVRIGRPVFIHGAPFRFRYSLHSIPTLTFRMEYQDQSFVYSSDHDNDPSVHTRLLDGGIISQERYDELSSFPWDSKVIFHEAGIPPLHTPVSYLDSLPEDIKKKIVVYHIAKKDFPEDTSLSLARFGIENTLYFKTKPPRFVEASQILGLLRHIDIFGDMPVSKAQQFLDIVEEEK
ncbi:MAG: MBL fold metallo-hydrolase, partial [Spirochaetota bacterium]